MVAWPPHGPRTDAPQSRAPPPGAPSAAGRADRADRAASGTLGGCWPGANAAIVCFLQVVLLLCYMARSSKATEPFTEQSRDNSQRERKVSEIIDMKRLYTLLFGTGFTIFIYFKLLVI